MALRLRFPVLVAVALAMISAGCSGDGGGDVQETKRTSEIDWVDCPPGTPAESCIQWAKVKVPIDYGKPEGDTIEIAVARDRANEPGQRIGALFVNPGGPGASVIDGPEESQKLIDSAKKLADACQAKYPELLPHLGTRDVARDMDQIRELLDEDKISYVGFSYGTAIGQVYADMFPDRVRAMVLDGIDDITQPSIEWNATQAVSTERAMQRFADACAAQPDCVLGSDPMGVVTNLKTRVQQAPIPAPQADRPLGPGEFNYGAVADGVNDAIFCTQWPTPPQPLTAVEARAAPPIVVISTTGDPATPYQAGVDLAQRLHNGVLVTHEGDGHTIYGEDNDCINEAVNNYLIDLKTPAANTTCS